MSRAVRQYSHDGYAGCVQRKVARSTGRLVGVYNGEQAGMDNDEGAYPWSTVCEEHGTVVCHQTLALARAHAADPMGWCEDCWDAVNGVQRAAETVQALREHQENMLCTGLPVTLPDYIKEGAKQGNMQYCTLDHYKATVAYGMMSDAEKEAHHQKLRDDKAQRAAAGAAQAALDSGATDDEVQRAAMHAAQAAEL